MLYTKEGVISVTSQLKYSIPSCRHNPYLNGYINLKKQRYREFFQMFFAFEIVILIKIYLKTFSLS